MLDQFISYWLLLLGSMTGIVQVYDIQTGEMVRDIAVHSCQVRGIEWASLHSFVTHACDTRDGAVGRSDLAFVNLKTGEHSIRDGLLIKLIKVSQSCGKELEYSLVVASQDNLWLDDRWDGEYNSNLNEDYNK